MTQRIWSEQIPARVSITNALNLRLVYYSCHLIGCGKNQKLGGNFQAYYPEKYVDRAENTLDYDIDNCVFPMFFLLSKLLSEVPSSSSSL